MRNWGAGDERARHCGSVAAVCRRFAHGIAVLLERLAFGSRLSFFLCQEKRDGLRCLAFLFRRVEIAIRAFSLCLYGYLPLAGSLRVCAFLYGDLDGLPGRGERGYGIRGRRRGLCALLCKHISLEMLSAGSTLGLRAPDCAKESSTLWTLFTLRRGYVGTDSRRRHPGTRVDPTGSNLWPGGSGCIAMLSTRTNVQTRAAPKRRRVGLQRAKRYGSRHCRP